MWRRGFSLEYRATPPSLSVSPNLNRPKSSGTYRELDLNAGGRSESVLIYTHTHTHTHIDFLAHSFPFLLFFTPLSEVRRWKVFLLFLGLLYLGVPYFSCQVTGKLQDQRQTITICYISTSKHPKTSYFICPVWLQPHLL